jgi:hypothetical protein
LVHQPRHRQRPEAAGQRGTVLIHGAVPILVDTRHLGECVLWRGRKRCGGGGRELWRCGGGGREGVGGGVGVGGGKGWVGGGVGVGGGSYT